MRVIDIHAHIIPPAFFAMVKEGLLTGITIEEQEGRPVRIVFSGGSAHPLTELFTSDQARLTFMEKHGIDQQVVSISPRLFFYELPGKEGAEICRRLNDSLLEIATKYPGRQVAMGTVPLQAPALAVKELEWLKEKGISSVQIGTFVAGNNLAEKGFWPFFEAAEALGMGLMIHPLITNDIAQMKDYHISNMVGNPWQTTVAAENLIFAGVFEQFPGLKVLLVHGGGFLPYQLGRMGHGYTVRPETRANIADRPEEYVKKNIFFDGLTHSKEALDFLLKVAGKEKVLFGTDYPYDMAEYDQMEKARSLGLTGQDLEKLAANNAEKWLGLK